MTLDPISPVRPPNINISSMSTLGLGGGSALTVSSLPPLGLGGAPFSTQYNPSPDDESTLPVQAILRRALSLGINLIDTSPYYGNSEIILGKALRAVWREGWDRGGMFICTKVGRVKLDEFDYRPESVRRSVERSFERLGVGVLDVVYCHDVEFVTTREVLAAVGELFKFKDEGRVRYVGISGLPVERLVELAETVQRELGRSLDVVLSYSNMTLQNSTLKTAVPKFHAAGVQRIITASPLSMGLLRSAGPLPWHPASQSQRDAVIKAGEYVEKQGHNLADTSMRYVYAKWDGCIICGWSNIKELEDAVRMWHRVKSGQGREEDERLWKRAREIMGKEVDTMWDSPEKGWVFSDGSKVE